MLPPNNRKGSGFTNINRVVTANQGNRLGQTVSSGVQNQATQVKDQTQQATTSFNQEAQKNRLDTEDSANKRDETIGRFSSPNQTTAQDVTDQEVQDFSKYRTGTYEGPKELQDYQSLAGKASNTEMLGDLSRSSGGRQELLKRFVGGSGYTQGQQNLDNVLLGQSGNALNQARRSTQGLSRDVSGANTQASNLANEYVNRAKIFGDETVNKLGLARNPISSQIDSKLKSNQGIEDLRQGNVQYIADSLMGNSEDYNKLDRVTRLGLALQSARDGGYLTEAQQNQLLGEGGLIQRSEQLGLDTNRLLTERLINKVAQNLNRGGAATNVQESQLNSLDKLLGKSGSDLEFNQPGADFKEGRTSFSLDSLNDYLNKMEQSKYGNESPDTIKSAQQRYLDLAQSGFGQSFGGATQLAGGALNQVMNPSSFLNPNETLQNTQNVAGGLTNMGMGQSQMNSQGTNALLEGLTKLNINGQSLGNTAGGKQLLKAIELKSKMEQEAANAGGQAVNGLTTGVTDLSKGNISGALGNLSGANLAKSLGSSLASNITKELAKITSNPVKSVSKSVSKKIKKVFSDENLKHNIKPADSKLYDLLDKLNAHEYEYNENVPADAGKHISVMAQELEKSELGKNAVSNEELGKMVDYEKLEPVQLAAIASIHKRLKKLEDKE